MSREEPTFETIDWGDHEPQRVVLDYQTIGFLVVAGTLAASFLYHYFFVPSGYVLFGAVTFAPLDWLTAAAVTLVTFYGVVPLVRDREVTLRYWRRLRRKPAAMVSLAYLLVLAVLGIVGPEVWGPPGEAPLFTSLENVRGTAIPPSQPPFWGTISIDRKPVLYCGVEVVNGRCPGTLVHPLGTTSRGRDVLAIVMVGARFTLQLTAITAAILVPLGTAVGATAAYVGGRFDVVVTKYLDLQGVLPAFLAYFLYLFLYGPSTVALVALFGFLGWDRVARRVRTDALRLRDAGFVRSARAAGSRPGDVIRRHVVPNVSATVVSALTIQLPFILLMEATFAFLGLTEGNTLVGADVVTWGGQLAYGLQRGGWWEPAFPLLALAGTIVALATLGNALYDTFETRREAT